MNLLEAKELIIQESEREKKITIRNIIIVAVLVVTVITLLLVFAMPAVKSYIAETASDENLNGDFSAYYKFGVPLILILSFIPTVRNLIAVYNRRKSIDQVFALISEGKECEIYSDYTKYLTVIPLLKIKFNLDPVQHLPISIDLKPYTLPVREVLVPDIKRALSNANLEHYQTVISELYGDTEVTDLTKAEIKSVEEFSIFAEREFSESIANMEKGRSKTKNMLYVQIAFAVILVACIVIGSSSGLL